MEIANKIAMVTGGADGIGRAITVKLLEKGAQGVAVVDINKEKGSQTVEELNAEYGDGKTVFIQCDVSNTSQLEAAYAKVKEDYKRLDIVCNNAGIGDEFNMELMVAINLTAVIRSTYLAVQYMGTKNGGNGGVVINTASRAGIVPWFPCSIYTATKHGVVGFTRSVAEEPMIKENKVRVAALCPGDVDTPLIASGIKCRYPRELKLSLERFPPMTPSHVADNVMLIIEDVKYDGDACLVYPGKPLTVIDPPNLEEILK
ncbi:15-hydroxyprostaglandin dehydrogenase [NAD(+)]-like [Saccoglossus kowalevskii]|uniref:15-hydroxyprostaglandin dehydrogenase [NAD(+)] n=1 Tax=Saccoglossus kowalevskii TaxID=10224 RepID=A0ABM0H1G4_SACKO|nr:PREDICTED: 15-hydroxyprostaglandin dehydrogenase [NAD(+)]-like [Saccoglossus kowalevskii]